MGLKKEDIFEIIKFHLKSDEFEFISCENVNSDISIGFLSEQGKFCIKYTTLGKEEELHVFVKIIPDEGYQRILIVEGGSFQRESLAFRDILADFQDYSIPIPKCYLAKPEAGIVVLEDLSHIGFTNKTLYEPLDLIHCEKVLESLAKFHAASFILENRYCSKLNEMFPIIETEVLINADHTGKLVVEAGIKGLEKVTERYLPYYPKDVTKKAFARIENLFNTLSSSKIYPNALSHTDMWGNNIMYKYDDDGNLEEVCLIDLQLLTYKPPTHDVQFFLHFCTTEYFRDKYYNQLLKHYFNCLSKQLLMSSINITDIMDWTDFENMQKETLPNVLAMMPIYLSFVMMPPHIINEVMGNDEKFKVYYEEDRTEYVLQAMHENGYFRNRNLQCLKELFHYCIAN